MSVVYGATGRAGREIVMALLAAGHDVVAVSRGELGGGVWWGVCMHVLYVDGLI